MNARWKAKTVDHPLDVPRARTAQDPHALNEDCAEAFRALPNDVEAPSWLIATGKLA